MRLFIISLCSLLLSLSFFISQQSWGIEIIEPAEGARLQIGTTARIVVRPAPSEKWNAVYFGFDQMNYNANKGVYVKDVTVLSKAVVGLSTLKVLAIDATGKEFELTRKVAIMLPNNVLLKSMNVEPNPAFLFKLPKSSDLRRIKTFETHDLDVFGLYTDEVQRDIASSSAGTVYSSSDDKIVTVDSNGKLTARGIGTANITVKNGDFNIVVKVIVKSKNR